MKLNNKGFAITAVLYGLLILFVLLVSSYLLVLSVKKDRVEILINDIEEVFIDVTGERNLKEYIISLYNDSDKTAISNNGITYNYANSVNLMNDGLGDYGGNVRYYGASPDNYIYFNCEIYPSSNCEKWRIIGVVDDKVKIVRDSSIGNLSWDYDYNDDNISTTSDNIWETATVQKLLNGDYYNGKDTSYYSNSTVAMSIKFATDGTGLKNVITRNMVSDSLWHLGGCYYNNIYSNEAYLCERNDVTTSWMGKIALIYPSDYGYAVDFDYCDVQLKKYNSNDCKSNNWLKFVTGGYKLLTPSMENQVWAIISDGNINSSNAPYTLSYYPYGIIPTLYLESDIVINGGNGSFNNPYKILV